MISNKSESQDIVHEPVEASSVPMPNDFMNFYPWACGQYQTGINVVISKMIQSEYIGSHVLAGRYEQKRPPVRRSIRNPMKAHVSVMKIESQMDMNSYSENPFSADPVIRVSAICNLSDRLVQLKFEKAYIQIPRQMIIILALIAKYHPYLVSISFKNCCDKYTIYELAKLAEISTITEVYLDGCYVREGNYALLLGDKCALKVLSLARCSLTDKIVIIIAEKLDSLYPAAKDLMILNLASNRITDIGAEALSRSLRSNRQLYHLNLSDNFITDKGAFSIFNIMIDFPINMDERIGARGRRFKYLIDKMELIRELISDMTWEEIVKQRRKSTKSLFSSSKIFEDRVEADIVDVAPHTAKRIKNRANCIAEDMLGVFTDPFHPTTTQGDIVYCFGNNTLQSLNLAYNNISVLSLRKILGVLRYQTVMNRKPKGLIHLNVEGNAFPIKCEELQRINSMMEVVSDTSRMLKTRRRSQYINITAT